MPSTRNKNTILEVSYGSMKKISLLFVLLLSVEMFSCGSSQKSTPVVKPRYHHVWPIHRWRIDVPLGARHIRFLERKRTKVVRMY